MTDICACTIISNNYLPFARVLARSFLEQHPEGRFFVLFVDVPHESIDYAAEPFESVFVRELPIPQRVHFSFRYSILELNTAVKPYFLEWLHVMQGLSSVCYFDPDILITGNLEPLYQWLEDDELLLTPHILEPIEDDAVPSERDFLLSGIYNLGFLGVSFCDTTLEFLHWWQGRLHRHCVHRVEEGLFVDQRWMDFAPAFVKRVHIIRDPGYNVAYWNLMHRYLDQEDGQWRVSGQPLRFFHFSGFDPLQPKRLSKYQNRLDLAERADVAPLFASYAESLLAQGYRELSQLPYGFGHFSGGSKIAPVARRMLQKVDPRGDRWPDPFDQNDASGFHRWLVEPAEPDLTLPLPRIALGVWQDRSDLQAAFPEPRGRDLRPFARWLVETGTKEARIGAEFVASLRRALTASVEEPSPKTSEGEEPRRRAGSMARLLLTRSPEEQGASRNLLHELDRQQVDALMQEATLDPSVEPRLPQLAASIHRQRPDLQRYYPHPFEADRKHYALWYTTYGRLEYGLPAKLVRPVLSTLPWRLRVWARLWWWKQRMRRLGWGRAAT